MITRLMLRRHVVAPFARGRFESLRSSLWPRQTATRRTPAEFGGNVAQSARRRVFHDAFVHRATANGRPAAQREADEAGEVPGGGRYSASGEAPSRGGPRMRARQHRRRDRAPAGAGHDLDDAEAQHPVGDAQVVRERLQQRGRARELQQVVLGLALMVDLVGQRARVPVVVALDRAAAARDRGLDVGEDPARAVVLGRASRAASIRS